MKLLLVCEDWISFYNQTESLAIGLKQLGIDYKAILAGNFEHFSKVCKEYKPDFVIGVGSWYSYRAFVEQPKKLGIRCLPWIVSNGGIHKYVDKYNKLPLILTPSNYCKNVLIKGNIKKDIIKIVPEAVDPEFWHQISNEELNSFLNIFTISSIFPLLPKFDLLKIRQDNIPILLTIGGDATSKGAQEVIQALAQLNPEIPWVYLIKTWPQFHTFKRASEEFKLLKKFKLENRIRYIVGEFSDEFIRGLISACDIYIAPSRGEGFGLPLVQAQMCGKPVVTTFGTSTQEIVVQERTGLICERGVAVDNNVRADITDLSRCLGNLITNPVMRQEMGKNAVSHARSNYSPKVIAQQFLTFLINFPKEN